MNSIWYVYDLLLICIMYVLLNVRNSCCVWKLSNFWSLLLYCRGLSSRPAFKIIFSVRKFWINAKVWIPDIRSRSWVELQNIYRFLTLHGSVYQDGIGSSGLGTRSKLKLIFQLRQFLIYRNVMYIKRNPHVSLSQQAHAPPPAEGRWLRPVAAQASVGAAPC